MEVTIVQALLIGLIYYLGANGTPWLTGQPTRIK